MKKRHTCMKRDLYVCNAIMKHRTLADCSDVISESGYIYIGLFSYMHVSFHICNVIMKHRTLADCSDVIFTGGLDRSPLCRDGQVPTHIHTHTHTATYCNTLLTAVM